MLSPRSFRTPRSSRARRRPGRALPALTLGVCTVALVAGTTVPADASPAAPTPTHVSTHVAAHAATSVHPSSAVPTSATAARRPTSSVHLTAAARRAGLEPGNATMGWRERGTARSLPFAERQGSLAAGPVAAARSISPAFTPPGVLGIDVSSYQGYVSWPAWTTLNKRFAYVKATEGTGYRNPYFLTQYGGAKRAGVIRGAYHFANPASSPGYVQARYFVRHGGGWSADGKTLPGVLDIEYNPYGSTCYGLNKRNMYLWVLSFTKEYKKLTRKDAVIYTTTDWWTRCTGNSSAFATRNPLWIARYGTTLPGTLPRGWTYATFWQYSSYPIDQDVFGGRLSRLKVLATKV